MDRLTPMTRFAAAAAVCLPCLFGCVRHQVEMKDPVRVEVEPIHMTVDVNIRVEREVEDAFGYLYGDEESLPDQDPTQTQ